MATFGDGLPEARQTVLLLVPQDQTHGYETQSARRESEVYVRTLISG